MVLAVAYGGVPAMAFGTVAVAVVAAFLGGMVPDLDESGAQFWRRMPAGAGSILGKMVAPVFGSHRFVTHSLLGLGLFGWGVGWVLGRTGGFLLVDQNIVWWAAMLGFGSHLVADALTKEGIPLLWPLPAKFGIPPFKMLRISTGGWMEKVYFVGLLAANAWVVSNHYSRFSELVLKP